MAHGAPSVRRLRLHAELLHSYASSSPCAPCGCCEGVPHFFSPLYCLKTSFPSASRFLSLFAFNSPAPITSFPLWLLFFCKPESIPPLLHPEGLTTAPRHTLCQGAICRVIVLIKISLSSQSATKLPIRSVLLNLLV